MLELPFIEFIGIYIKHVLVCKP